MSHKSSHEKKFVFIFVKFILEFNLMLVKFSTNFFFQRCTHRKKI
jgi:hypothetical protein